MGLDTNGKYMSMMARNNFGNHTIKAITGKDNFDNYEACLWEFFGE